MKLIDAETVRAQLTHAACIPLVRAAMIALSTGQTRQLLRSVIPLVDGHMFGIMSGALAPDGVFGAKLVSVWPENFAAGKPSHQGVVVLFDPVSGAPTCVVDAGSITAIRTAAASAVATDALARRGVCRLAVLGYGEQAEQHVLAMIQVRSIQDVRIWGRNLDRAAAFAERMTARTGLIITPCAEAKTAVQDADVICACTNAAEPVLMGQWVSPGAHVNLVGSSVAGPAEADEDLVAMSRFIVDSRAGVLAQGAEFLRAKASGRIDEDHIAGEIGQVLAGSVAGRGSPDEVTVYKSLGHIVQDLAAAALLQRLSAPSD
ncbi:ornithine cyclodeaminase family protein [Caulobacter sp.]|uniref:ornithine cyclodeaminase family protein n=1 Tax=Caulobacter sp. TaxID=78 RepID=UPI0031DA638A